MLDGRVTHLADLMHRAEASNGSAVSSNWILSTDGTKRVRWRPESAGGALSYGSNASDVASASAAGASSLVTRADHVHRGVRTITSNGSNGLFGDVNLVAGSGIALGVVGQNLTVTNTGTGGSGGGGSGGASIAYVGYDAIGATTEAGADTKRIAKQITLASAGVLLAIEGYVKGSNVDDHAFAAAIYTDDGEPLHAFAYNQLGTASVGGIDWGGADLPRWVSVPMARYLAAGTYWIVFGSVRWGGNTTYYYDVGIDKTFTSFNNSGVQDNPTMTGTLKKYSVRAPVITI